MRRRSKTPRAKLIAKLDKAIGQYIRDRDEYTCQKCGKMVEGSNCHVSHVIPRSAGNALRWDENNLKVLCFKCHIGWWHKEPTASGEWFKEKFPDRWDYLESKRNTMVQFKIHDLQELLDSLKTH